MKNSTEHLTMEEAERRALTALSLWSPVRSASVADVIWPGHKMRRQGAGFAAARVLERLKHQGLVQWVVLNNDVWGWVLSGKKVR